MASTFARLGVALICVWLLPFPALARKPEQPAGAFSIDLDQPFEKVVAAVREVAGNGVILGTFEYKDAQELPDAEAASPCPFFAPWTGAGEVLCKVRRKAISPAHFIGSNDLGTVAVRYVVQPRGVGSTRLLLDAVFVEDARRRQHASDGLVETSEFGLIQQRLRESGQPAAEAGQSSPPPSSSSSSAPVERTYSYPLDHVQRTLQQLGGYAGGPLPMLEGFVSSDAADLNRYQRPYYQYHVEVLAPGPGHSTVKLEAKISAWDAGASAYRSLPSNGRLENDLLERLQQALTPAQATVPATPISQPMAPEPSVVSSSRPPAPQPSNPSDLDFWVSREQINSFSGDWERLKGKKVLFVFAQSRGALPDVARDDRKLVYAKRIFADRYRSASLTRDPFQGVVVVFTGGKGGVAAATISDIKQWVQGALNDDDFVKRCSLDPAGEFLGIH